MKISIVTVPVGLLKHWPPVVGFVCGIIFAASARAADGSAAVTRDSSTGTEWATIAPRIIAHVNAITKSGAGQSVVFEVADGWRGVSPKTTIPLTSEWREHVVEFELKNPFNDETRLRFMLPQEATGTSELTDFYLRELDNLPTDQK